MHNLPVFLFLFRLQLAGIKEERSSVDHSNMSPTLRSQLLVFQKTELTEYHIYSAIARQIKDDANRQVLEKIARDALAHARLWQE